MTRDYVNRRTAGDEPEARRVGTALRDALSHRYHAGEIAGYFMYFIETPEEAADEILPDEFFSGICGKFPFLYARVNYREDDERLVASVEAIVLQAGFEFVF